MALKFRKEGFLTDFKRVQVISGLAATSGILMTIAVLLFVPMSAEAKKGIIIVCVLTLIFNAIYYLIPKLYLNKKLAYVPDLVYISAITAVMRYLGPYNYIYYIFYMILTAVDAFVFPFYQYIVVVLGMLAGIIIANVNFANGTINSSVIYQLYGVITLAVVTHAISRDALRIKDREEVLEVEIAELENDKREIRILLESISDGMFVVNKHGKVTFFNKSALSILNMVASDERILGKSIETFLPTIGPKGKEEITKEVFETLKPSIRDNFRIVTPDRTFKLHTNITPVLNEEGKLQGAIIFFRDITKEKKFEEQQAEFNAVASHELRTPLSVIEGYLFFLLDPSSKTKYDKMTKEYLVKAHQASQDLIRLITDILTVVKADEKEIEVTLEEIDVWEFAREVAKDFEKDAAERGLNYTVKLAPDKKIQKIITDKSKARSILSNLIRNAIKFTEKGSVTIEVGALANEAVINVVDTGVGIEKEDLKFVFQKFFRAENWQTRKTGGTGLGLYIVKTLADRLGGRVGVQSELGKGSRFYFTLPFDYKNKDDLKKVPEKELRSFISSF